MKSAPITLTASDYDRAANLMHDMRMKHGGCFAPKGAKCDETHCECAQIAFNQMFEDHYGDGVVSK